MVAEATIPIITTFPTTVLLPPADFLLKYALHGSDGVCRKPGRVFLAPNEVLAMNIVVLPLLLLAAVAAALPRRPAHLRPTRTPS